MNRSYRILLLILAMVGCARPSPQSPTLESDCTLGPGFSSAFERLFLSNEPLRYQDNVAFLEAICPAELGVEDKDLVKTRLIQFLSLTVQDREFAPDSEHTGVASEIAFLRLQAVQLLGEVGTKEDIEFIQSLLATAEGEHPLFEDACKNAVDQLHDR